MHIYIKHLFQLLQLSQNTFLYLTKRAKATTEPSTQACNIQPSPQFSYRIRLNGVLYKREGEVWMCATSAVVCVCLKVRVGTWRPQSRRGSRDPP